jgi:hypothetical protein
VGKVMIGDLHILDENMQPLPKGHDALGLCLGHFQLRLPGPDKQLSPRHR